MKLTGVLIISVLLLTASQLITAGDSGDKQWYRAVRSILGKRNRLDTRECLEEGSGCTYTSDACCPHLRCRGTHAGAVCVEYQSPI
nr:TPA_inf: conotoxin precursor O1 [Conus ebraeus]